MVNIHINYDLNEIEKFKDEFNYEPINEILVKNLLFQKFDEIKESFKYEQIDLINDYTKPYYIDLVKIELDENNDTIINLKVKNKDGRTCPRLVPYGKSWFVCGDGSRLNNIDVCDSLESIARVFKNRYSGEYSFKYMCVIDNNLEVVDWNSFYNWYDNQDYVKTLKENILEKGIIK